MTHASLFSGIGGFDLAAEWMGWQNVFNCEIDPFCRKVLAYHFPNAKQYEDVKTTDFTIHRGHVDVLTGGFPCQPFSLAGKRKGANDDRYLWPEMLRAIREIQPRWVVGENVLGIVNWSNGMVFEQVQADLEAAGYEVQPFLIPACAVDAPHRRDRVWFVAHCRNARSEILQRERAIGICESAVSAHANNERLDQFEHPTIANKEGQSGWSIFKRVIAHASLNGLGRPRNGEGCSVSKRELLAHQPQGREVRSEPIGCVSERTTADSRCDRSGSRTEEMESKEPARQSPHTSCDKSIWGGFSKFPTQSPVCSGDDGLSDRLDSITFPAWRRESIKAYGNAVVPQIPYLIFQTIEQFNELWNT